MNFDRELYVIIPTPCCEIYTGDTVLYKGKIYFFKGNGATGYLYKNINDMNENKNKIVAMRSSLQRVRQAHLTDETEPPRIAPKYASCLDSSSGEDFDEEVVSPQFDEKTMQAFQMRRERKPEPKIPDINFIFHDSLERASKNCTPEAYKLLLSLAQRYTQTLTDSLYLEEVNPPISPRRAEVNPPILSLKPRQTQTLSDSLHLKEGNPPILSLKPEGPRVILKISDGEEISCEEWRSE